MENQRADSCFNGHPYTRDSHTVDPGGYKRCRVCAKEAARRHRERNRLAREMLAVLQDTITASAALENRWVPDSNWSPPLPGQRAKDSTNA